MRRGDRRHPPRGLCDRLGQRSGPLAVSPRARTIHAAQSHGPQHGGLLPVVRTGAVASGCEVPTQDIAGGDSCTRGRSIALLAIIGYSYSAVGLIGIRSFIPMALNTAVAFALLQRGDPAARPSEGLMAIISSTGAGGVMARRLLPATILIPAAAGWLRWYAQQHGVVDEVMGLSLFVLTNIVVFSVLIWWNAASLNRTDAELQKAKEAALKPPAGPRAASWPT